MYNIIRKLKEKKVFIVSEEGWFYSRIIDIYFDKEKAIQKWEEVTKLLWASTDYENYVANVNRNHEGFWYYSLKEMDFNEILTKFSELERANEFYKKRDEIVKKAENIIESKAYETAQKEYEKLIQSSMYYLIKCGLFSLDEYNQEESKQTFIDNIEKLKLNI